MDLLSPASSAAFIAENAKYISVNRSSVESLAIKIFNVIRNRMFSSSSWREHPLTPKDMSTQSVDWIFVTDLLNFSFWSSDNYEVEFKGKTYIGYWSLCAAINRSIESGLDLTKPEVYRSVTEEELRHAFRSVNGNDIPLFSERLKMLNAAGEILCNKFQGSFVNVLSLCENSAIRLIELLCDYFPSFRDTAVYLNKEVSFMKRAQILVGDLWSCFDGAGHGFFHDVDQITAFADYRVPQVLAYHNVLIYNDSIKNTLFAGRELPNGSQMEVEIRGLTVYAIQLIVEEIRKRLSERRNCSDEKPVPCNAILVDHYLWIYRRSHADEIDRFMPMHKTRCIYY